MSRIGKVPIKIPEKVEVKIDSGGIAVKGPKGLLSLSLNDKITIQQEKGELLLSPKGKGKKYSEIWGTFRTLVANMVTGVSQGFVKKLEFKGVGYKVFAKGSTLQLNLGHSHPINYELPEGISAKVVKNIIEISGSDKSLIGFVAAKIRSFRPPEPYKGKGVKYIEERIIRKAGKTGAKAK
ncbi:MAG: 50S ribosomal protein L6 [Halobacteriovoraceae bacterium]|nr:50S ribosomal protein L6 [Halobacteriovoraceae bacterium]